MHAIAATYNARLTIRPRTSGGGLDVEVTFPDQAHVENPRPPAETSPT